MNRGESMRVACTECRFEAVARADDGRPAELVRDHGLETGHQLELERVGQETVD